MISVFDEQDYVQESGHEFTKCEECGTFLDFTKDDLQFQFVEPYGRVFKSIPIGYYEYYIKCPCCHSKLFFKRSDIKKGFK